MKIDLESKKTEAERQKSWDKFSLSAAPRWFEWLGWLLILGALGFLTKETKNIPLGIVTSISFAIFLQYFQSYFYQFEFKNIPFIKTPRTGRIVSLILSGILGLLMIYLFISVFSVLTVKGT